MSHRLIESGGGLSRTQMVQVRMIADGLFPQSHSVPPVVSVTVHGFVNVVRFGTKEDLLSGMTGHLLPGPRSLAPVKL